MLSETGRSYEGDWTTLPWWQTDTTASQLLEGTASLARLYSGSPHLKSYFKVAAIQAVYISNSHEQTLPKSFKSKPAEVLQLLDELWNASSQPSSQSPASTWHSDGGKDSLEGKTQLLQHTKALSFLCITTLNQPLTPALLLQGHAILMGGAYDSSGMLIPLSWRQIPCRTATGHEFMAWNLIPDAVEACLAQLDLALAHAPSPPYGGGFSLFHQCCSNSDA